jgi:5'-methylthioadenosine phosphorylase
MLGIIGGSGLYGMEELKATRWERVRSPFGEPSDALLLGELHGQPVAFLPRHGRGHVLPPAAINYRANIDALKRVGVTDVISLSAVGSLREEFRPGSFVLVDQFVDRTLAREKSFFGPGLVAHVSMARPVCPRIGAQLEAGCRALELSYHVGGTYVVMEGPQFSTLAESRLYQQWDCDVVGMTNMPEAKLAREAELCYATIAMVTDYDCWSPTHGTVTVPEVLAVMNANGHRARALVSHVARRLAVHPECCPAGCDRGLDTALITAPEARAPEMIARLDAVAGRVLGKGRP